jgi:hypothetical protein
MEILFSKYSKTQLLKNKTTKQGTPLRNHNSNFIIYYNTQTKSRLGLLKHNNSFIIWTVARPIMQSNHQNRGTIIVILCR